MAATTPYDQMASRIREIAFVFLKLGTIGFGGPAAHIAMMQRELVQKRKWLTESKFLDLIGVTNLIPGPNSTELAIHLGYERGGWKGLITAGVCFIAPAVAITALIAWFYSLYAALPRVAEVIKGTTPAIIAIIIFAIIPLAKTSAKNRLLILIGLLVLILALLGTSEILLMFGSGILYALITHLPKRPALNTINPILILTPALTSQHLTPSNGHLFLIFLKIGAILYGSGYVLFAFLETELVSTGIISPAQLIDAITVGQLTPGPVFSAVTFVGYQINGIPGAIIATVAIFLPSFLFVALLSPLMAKLRTSSLFASFLDAVNIASVALIVGVCANMAKSTLTHPFGLITFLITTAILFRFPKTNSAVLILGSAILSLMYSFL